MNLKAVIMAGGEGTRLRPITCSMPKPLVPIVGRPVIDYCLELLKKHEITDVVTTVYYLSDMIERHVGSGEKYGMSITHSKAPRPLGTAGSVRHARTGNSPVLIISGDTLTDCDISDAYEYHKSHGACATIVLKRVSAPTEYGVALLDNNGRITRFYEKPVQSEVFSDLANTGIYILEPSVLELIPENTSFDFSMDLFPLLLERNMPVYGYEMQGYWCDIGNIKQYMQAQKDVLDRKTAFEIHAKNTNGIYTEDDVHISENAKISTPCYIGRGTEIGENARIESYSCIGRCVKVYENASIKRSVIMDGCVLRENSEIRGAIICPEASVDKFSAVFEGSCIGKNAKIGQSVSISGGAKVWPDKHISDNMGITENVVWGEGARMEITDRGISGYCDTDVSPETAVRIGSSFAQSIPSYGQIAVSCDGRRVTSMLKRAVTSGVISQGADVLNLPHMPFCLFSFTVRQLGVAGGIYVSTDITDSHRASIVLCDSTGTAVPSNVRRKVDRIFEYGEQKPVTHREIGIVEDVSGSVRAYEAELLRSTGFEPLFNSKKIKVLLDVPAQFFEVCAPLLLRQGIDTVSADTDKGMNMQAKLSSLGADLGFYITENKSIVMPCIMQRDGKSLQGSALYAAFCMDALISGRRNRFTVPVTFPDEYARLLMDKGAQLITAPEQWHSLQRAAYNDNTFMYELFDPAAAILRAVKMHVQGTLDSTISSLPATYKQEYTVPCDDFGKVLRTLSLSEQREDTEHIDGIKIHRDKGWVIVKAADDGLAACRIICGSFNEEYANELSGMYIDKLKGIINSDGAKQ